MRTAERPAATYTYDAANQLETSADSSGTTTYTSDAAGNLTGIETSSGQLTTYTWDDENRRTRVLLPSGQLVTALYNGDSLRVQKEDPDGVVKFIWDEQRYLIETDDNDTTQGVYTSQPTPYGNLISQKFGDKLFYHFDGLGSTRALTNASETITESFLYDAYGNRLSTNTTIPPFLYVGELGYYYDPFVLDYYIRVRTYDPAMARWLSRDPLSVLNPMIVSLFNYSENTPTNIVDPSGQLGKYIQTCLLVVRFIPCKATVAAGLCYGCTQNAVNAMAGFCGGKCCDYRALVPLAYAGCVAICIASNTNCRFCAGNPSP